MRTILGLATLALTATAAIPVVAQSYAPPRGSYERLCTDISMNGQFLSAVCRGERGSASSTINVLSCSTDITVDREGGLTCIGPGGGAPPYVRDAPPGYGAPPYGAPAYGNGAYGNGRPGGRDTVMLYEGRNWSGQPLVLDGGADNLNRSGLNDRVRSIRLPNRAGRWLVCEDANFKGRCVTIRGSIADTRQIGMARDISSIRPLR